MFLPCTLFETVARFDDYRADDMQSGDMEEHELALGFRDVSAKVDPYQLVRYDFSQTHNLDGIFSDTASDTKITHEKCVDILFTEMKELSSMFSLYGDYKALIGEMIEHFRYGNGRVFVSQKLNSAFHLRLNKASSKNPVAIIRNILQKKFYNKSKDAYLPFIPQELKVGLLVSYLVKFNLPEDKINDLGITVHDISVQKIRFFNIQRYAHGWSATLHFEAQDHFGLDVIDISNKFYNEFRFFRIWPFLQRHRAFSFKPFSTNFGTVVRMDKY